MGHGLKQHYRSYFSLELSKVTNNNYSYYEITHNTITVNTNIRKISFINTDYYD